MPEETQDKETEAVKIKEKPSESKAVASDTEEMKCTSCGKRIESERFWVEFHCPACEGENIIRCEKCKSLENPYKCSKCGFKGP